MITDDNTATITREKNIDVLEMGYQDLERLTAKASIPTMSGVAGYVLHILQERIGRSHLGIKDVAQEMGISKRTLQRHLRTQMVSFASLRDRVRFNRAINCLLHGKKNIEEISKYLGFSDRTSFTNAFRRWSGSSPGVFRKLYRDYV